MIPESDQLRRVIGGIRRRAVVVRLSEGAGSGVVAGSLVAILIVPFQLHLGLIGLAVCLGLAALAGGVWGMVGRPTALGIAMEADRQMGTGELISTAWMVTHVRRPSAVDMENVVVAMAEARCGETDGRRIGVARFSGRGWMGIALLTGFSITLNLLAVDWGKSLGGSGSSLAEITAGDRLEMEQSGAADMQRGRPGGGSPGDADRSFGNDLSAEADGAASAGRGDWGNQSGVVPDGSSGGIGRSDVQIIASRMTPTAMGDSHASDRGILSSGVGGVATNSSKGEVGGSMGAAAQVRAAAGPWETSQWAPAVHAARMELQSGKVDSRYEDLVWDYFNRNENK